MSVNRETAVGIWGGELTAAADLQGALPQADVELVIGWVERTQQFVDWFCDGAGSPPVTVALTKSPGLALRAKSLDDGIVVVLVPIGLVARARQLAALLRSYPERDHTMRVVASLLDDRPESDWELPSDLRPLLGEYDDHDLHWGLIQRASSELPSPRAGDGELDDILWSLLNLAVMHEVAHALRGHLEVAEKLAAAPAAAHPVPPEQLRRALEIDADLSGVMLFLGMAETELDIPPEDRNAAFEAIGFAVTLLYGMYDTRRKALGLYGDGRYPHPLVRHKLFADASLRHWSEHRPEWANDWNTHERAGWTRCVKAFWRLDEDCFLGRFSSSPQNGAQTVPVTALNYNVFDSAFTDEQADRELALLDTAHRVLDEWLAR